MSLNHTLHIGPYAAGRMLRDDQTRGDLADEINEALHCTNASEGIDYWCPNLDYGSATYRDTCELTGGESGAVALTPEGIAADLAAFGTFFSDALATLRANYAEVEIGFGVVSEYY